MDTLATDLIAMFRIRRPLHVDFKPQPDITAFELAQLLPFFFMNRGLFAEELPTDPALLRHLVVHDPNK